MKEFMIKNILSSLNGWKRIFVVLVIFVQTPLTALFVYSQSSGYIEIEELNVLANELYDQKKIPTKARIYSFSEGEKINITSLKLADLDYDVSDIPLVNKMKHLNLTCLEREKKAIAIQKLLNILLKNGRLILIKQGKVG